MFKNKVPGCGGAPPVRGEVVPRRERVAAVRGAWMQAASCGVISFFTLSRSMGKIFCTNASSCCLNSSAGYFASTCASQIGRVTTMRIGDKRSNWNAVAK